MKRTHLTSEETLFLCVVITLAITSAILIHYHLFIHQSIVWGICCGFVGLAIATAAILVYSFKKKKDKARKEWLAATSESKLDLLRSQFIQYISFYGGEDKEKIIAEINKQFEDIYRMADDIQSSVYKDDILSQTGKLFYNTTNANEAYNTITKQLLSTTDCTFVRQLTQALYDNTCTLKQNYIAGNIE